MLTGSSTNNFLSEMNRTFFQPRGVFCLLMTWKPELDDINPTIDLTNTISGVMNSQNAGLSQKFRKSDAVTYGDLDVPKAAPLVFPALDAAMDAPEGRTEGKSSWKDSMHRKQDFIRDYYDRRAQATYVGLHLSRSSHFNALRH